MAQRTVPLNKPCRAVDPRIIEDVQRLHRLLGPELIQVALFGSCAKKSFSEARDIDLALFTRSRSVSHIADAVSHQQFNFAIDQQSISLSYGGGGGIKQSPSIKAYDVVVLASADPDPYFMNRNGRDLIYLSHPYDGGVSMPAAT